MHSLVHATSFGAFGGTAGVTNQGINTVVNGDLGTTAACTLITGFHDVANVYTETTLNIGTVNGSVNCAPPAPGTAATMAIADQARADALIAYNDLAAMPAGSDPGAGQLGGLVLPPAVYTSAGSTFAITETSSGRSAARPALRTAAPWWAPSLRRPESRSRRQARLHKPP